MSTAGLSEPPLPQVFDAECWSVDVARVFKKETTRENSPTSPTVLQSCRRLLDGRTVGLLDEKRGLVITDSVSSKQGTTLSCNKAFYERGRKEYSRSFQKTNETLNRPVRTSFRLLWHPPRRRWTKRRLRTSPKPAVNGHLTIKPMHTYTR